MFSGNTNDLISNKCFTSYENVYLKHLMQWLLQMNKHRKDSSFWSNHELWSSKNIMNIKASGKALEHFSICWNMLQKFISVP